ncbi:MAG: arginine--tRNA ligase [Methanotrichaceae archaeon]|nr:arginine--tRNA ligase [Methanotrichaceae archaeon]
MFLDFMREVELSLLSALERSGFKVGMSLNNLELDRSPHADLASSVAFRLAPELKRKPASIAAEIHQALPAEFWFVGRAECIGPYLNFFMSLRFLNEVLEQAIADNCWFGGLKEKVIVEHTSANPDGPLHVGHIRNSVIGDTLVRILHRAGCTIEAQYYINDMGRQEAMVVWGADHFRLENIKNDHAIAQVYIAAHKAMESQPEIKREADEIIRQYEAGDSETESKIKSAVKFALSGIEETLQRLDIHHDSYHWESEFVRNGDVDKVIAKLEETGLTIWKDGALQLDLTSHGFEKNMILRRTDGTSLYITRDLAYHRWKAANCDRIVDILGADHKLISSQLKTALNLMGIREPEVVIFEFVSLPTGSMSTRRGKFISADEVLDEVESRAFEEVSKRRPNESEEFRRGVAKYVASGAIRYDIVKVSADKATTFDWRQALDFEKLSAPFIQYSYARACSILRKAENIDTYNPDLLKGHDEVALIKKIAEFDLVIELAARELKPHTLATYARELAEAFNQFYRYCPVLESRDDLRLARLALVKASRNALRATLETLGIQALEAM